ncbi:glycerol-3-phospate dehydrogenase [Scheffersomyces xylosifermentans]|uniref:glycerol-3-phospate dehydrogenase n=1 Tax=Scheffersomyces xylosifermentans TaxID=1304137 RepID=UPI00315D7CF6
MLNGNIVLRSLVPKRFFHASSPSRVDFSHVVVGGGVVGTAIASELQAVDGNSVLLVEKNEDLGMETTSRNSEVIHAGLYYPKDSLKGQLCIRGKNKIYDAWEKGLFQVQLKKCGKWVVAQNDSEAEYLDKLYKNCQDLDVPVSMVSPSLAKSKYPHIRAEAGALESPTTGIISAHELTTFYQSNLELREGTIAFNTKVNDIQFNKGDSSYTLQLLNEDGSDMEVTANNVVNSAGLYAPKIANLILPVERHYKSFFAKGSYFSFQPETPISSSKITDKLIYPCPNPNASSLGTHLTLDLGGQIKFGPDLEWLDIEDASQIDYSASSKNQVAAYEAVKTYFPGITLGALQPSYSGVRPKILSADDNKKRFADFVIKEEDHFPGFVNLLGMESPGLTASWAIADYVRDIYHK